MGIKLKPCPFCKNSKIKICKYSRDEVMYAAYCDLCRECEKDVAEFIFGKLEEPGKERIINGKTDP